MVPCRVIDAEAQELAAQHVELQALHQLPFRADRVERLQQHRPREHLPRDRRPPHPRVERREIAQQHRQRRVRHFPDRPHRMVLPRPLLRPAHGPLGRNQPAAIESLRIPPSHLVFQ